MDDLFGLVDALSPGLAFVYIVRVCIKARLGPCCFVWVMAVCQWEGTALLLHPFVYSSKGHIFFSNAFFPSLLLIFVLSLKSFWVSRNLRIVWTAQRAFINTGLLTKISQLKLCKYLIIPIFTHLDINYSTHKLQNSISFPPVQNNVCDFHVLTCVHSAFVLPQMSHSRLHSFSVLTQSHQARMGKAYHLH